MTKLINDIDKADTTAGVADASITLYETPPLAAYGYTSNNPDAPFLATEPANQIDLWDSDPLLACCTTPIGYHPSTYGDCLNALVLFGQITGIDPETLLAEFDSSNTSSAAFALGISAPIAAELAVAAEDTLVSGNAVPEPTSMALLLVGLGGVGAACRRTRVAARR